MTDDLLARANLTIAGLPAREQCSQCGLPWNQTPCGPTHAVIAADFISAGRCLVPELVAEVERLQAVVQRVTTLAGRWLNAIAWSDQPAIAARFGALLTEAIRGDS